MASSTEPDTILSKAAASSENVGTTTSNSPTNESHDLPVKSELNIDIISAALDPNPNDPLNPQNWPKWKKNTVFFALMSSSILCDGGMTWGASLFVANAKQWHIPMSLSTTSVNYGILLQGFGGVFAVPFIEHYGRCVRNTRKALLTCTKADRKTDSRSGFGLSSLLWAWLSERLWPLAFILSWLSDLCRDFSEPFLRLSGCLLSMICINQKVG